MENYTTTDYGLANWLVFSGLELLGSVEFSGNTRKSFVFVHRADLDELIAEWQQPTTDEAAICKAFFKAHTLIKRNLRESLNAAEVARSSRNN